MKSDIPNLLKRIDKLLEALDQARGTSQQLVKAAPLEIHFYNLATGGKRELEGFKAMIDDFQGTYLEKK